MGNSSNSKPSNQTAPTPPVIDNDKDQAAIAEAAAKAIEDARAAELKSDEASQAAAAEAAARVAAAEADLEVEGAPKVLEADEDGKIEVETTGDFMLLDPISGEEVSANGASTVTLTSFIQQRYELGQLKPA